MVNYRKLSDREIIDRYNNMRNRCYSPAYLNSHSWYKGCTVCDEWLDPEHGLERFGQWLNENYYIIDGEGTMQLEKDIKVPGNKIYSPDTCLIAPKRINCMFSGFAKKNENDLPAGVCFDERKQQYYPRLKDLDGKYIACKERYNTPEEARAIYILQTMDYVNTVAESYRPVITEDLYNAMINWQFPNDD